MNRYISEQLRALVTERAAGICEYCLISIEDTYFGAEIDHIISIKHGGQSIIENLALACQTCNRNKGSDIGSIAFSTKRFSRFFNPRKDKWSKHFRLNDAVIEPLTKVGEVTVKIFGFNENDRLLERNGLIEIKHYPSPAAKKRMK